METSRFFRVVWRLNALVILVAGVLAVGVLLFVARELAQDAFRPRQAHGTATITADVETETAWRLGHLSTVEGGPFSYAPLWADQSSDRDYFSKSESSTRNLLFLDASTNASHWLFSDHDQLIWEYTPLTAGCEDDGGRTVRAMLLELIRDDINGDGRWTTSDRHTLGLTRPDGRGYREIMTDVDKLVGHRLVGDDLLVVVFERDDAVHSVQVSLTDFTVLDEATIPVVG